METLIRPRTDDDFEPLIDAARVVSQADRYPVDWPDDPHAWLRTREPIGAWVAERGGELVGHVVLRSAVAQAPVLMWSAVTGHDPGTSCVVSRLFVVPSARGHGVAQALLETVCAAADERHLKPVLDVVDHNRAAIRLYQRLGWDHLGTFSEAFRAGGPVHTLQCFAAP